MKKTQNINVRSPKVERSENVKIGDDNSINSNPRTAPIWGLFIGAILIIAFFLVAQRLGC